MVNEETEMLERKQYFMESFGLVEKKMTKE